MFSHTIVVFENSLSPGLIELQGSNAHLPFDLAKCKVHLLALNCICFRQA